MTSRQGRIIAILGSAFVGILFLIVSLNSLRWIGTTFPGFFVMIAVSSVLGGSVPINAGALSGFIFPLSLAYAIVKQDIFELDLALRRGSCPV